MCLGGSYPCNIGQFSVFLQVVFSADTRNQLQSLGTFLDDKNFQLETIAYKDQLTKGECLTFQIEPAPDFKELANEFTSWFRKSLFHTGQY